jgi:mono/diheme cytochrome c family protein
MRRMSEIVGAALALTLVGGAFGAAAGPPPQVPRGWRFSLEAGDAAAGEQVFVKMECFSCHKVEGRTFFERPDTDTGGQGPELGRGHARLPREYLAESILSRHKVIAGNNPRYRGEDKRSSKMGDYGEIMTVRELKDVVEYLVSLR